MYLNKGIWWEISRNHLKFSSLSPVCIWKKYILRMFSILNSAYPTIIGSTDLDSLYGRYIPAIVDQWWRLAFNYNNLGEGKKIV